MRYTFQSDNLLVSSLLGGLSFTNGDKSVSLTALVPFIDPKSIKVSFKNGFLTVKAKRKNA